MDVTVGLAHSTETRLPRLNTLAGGGHEQPERLHLMDQSANPCALRTGHFTTLKPPKTGTRPLPGIW